MLVSIDVSTVFQINLILHPPVIYLGAKLILVLVEIYEVTKRNLISYFGLDIVA
ncbi:hypothetical protein SDC9_178314 [bioreactor metagenome]|uniref:Uncharacterized protein n=1 Tax=bioreactor metagenome TaxID=1076179 RepID=A0A645H4S3_9ZZZZ